MPTRAPFALLANLLSPAPDWNLLLSPQPWASIKDHAGREGVAPLVAFAARGFLKAEERAWCDGVLTRSWRKHDTALQQLTAIVSLFHTADIRCIALKGPLLARRLYSPPFLRKPSGDLDFAVRMADLERAAGVLEKEGYSLLTGLKEATLTSYHVVLRHPSRLPVELHFRLSHGVLGIPVDEFFDRDIPYQIPSGPVARVLGAADELMFLVLHLVDDRFATLFHSYEVRRLWLAASAETRHEVIGRIIDKHFIGVLMLCDVSVRAVWGESLLPADAQLPRTWLHRRLNEKLYFKMAGTAGRGLEQPLGKRLSGRWLDLQTTDRPADALRRIASLLRVALCQLQRRNWTTGRISG